MKSVIPKDYLIEADLRIARVLWQCIPLYLLAAIILVLAYSGAFKPQQDDPATWFQRSGSLVVIVAVWIELRLLTISGDVKPTGSIAPEHFELIEKYLMYYKIENYSAALLAIIGTVVWGYGDLLR